MARGHVIQREVRAAFEASPDVVLAKYAAEDVQRMGQLELQHVKYLLGHGDDWTTWMTPREWFPVGSRSHWNVRIEERVLANLRVHLKQPVSRGSDVEPVIQGLVDSAVLNCNRYLVLCRIAPVSLRNGRDSLDPSVLAMMAHQSVAFIAAIAVANAMVALDEVDTGFGEGKNPSLPLVRFASVSRENVDALPLSNSVKLNIKNELKRMHAASDRGLWTDAPLWGVDPKILTRVSGDFDTPTSAAHCEPHLPLPDAYVEEIGTKSHWIIENLGPNILRVLSNFQNLWQEAHESKDDIRTVSDRCAAILKNEVWIDATGQVIEKLPFPLKLSQRGSHSKKTSNDETAISRGEIDADVSGPEHSTRTEAWPPRRAAQLFGLAKVLQGAHLFVAGLSTGSRNGEILTIERGAIRNAPDGTAFVNGRTYKLVRRHNGEWRDWPIPDLAVRAFVQQAKLIALMERLSPINPAKPMWSPAETTYRSNLWFGSGNRGRPATSTILAELLRHYSRSLGLEQQPGGQAIRLHRLRKTLARLVALAIVQAPKLLQDVFGHKNIEMTLYYILTDKALSAEIDEIVRELRIIRCSDDLTKFVTEGETQSSLGDLISFEGPNPPTAHRLHSDGFGGPAAASIRRAVAEQRQTAHRRSEDWGAESIRDLAEILTLGGTTWNLVRPGVMCTKSLNQFGPCNRKRGHPDPSSCQTSCDHRLEQAWLREEVDDCISQALEHWEFEIASQQELVAEFWAGQVRMHLGRFPDLEKKWRLDPRVELLVGSAGQ
ncbi:hypothetical protein GCM10027032_30100 [Simplicispira piscis]